jgi:hypothetical protein
MTMVIRSIAIRRDQDLWLRSHKELNFSAFIQMELDREIKRRNEYYKA